MGQVLALRLRTRTGSRPGPKRTSPRTAVRAWWSRNRLDRELAEGADPASDPLLARRADQLARASTRRRIAASLDTVIAEAERPGAGMSSEAPVQNRFVRDASPALHELVERLEADGPVEPRGVALALQLLTDAAGPLYSATEPEAPARAAISALNGLENGDRVSRNPLLVTDHRQCMRA